MRFYNFSKLDAQTRYYGGMFGGGGSRQAPAPAFNYTPPKPIPPLPTPPMPKMPSMPTPQPVTPPPAPPPAPAPAPAPPPVSNQTRVEAATAQQQQRVDELKRRGQRQTLLAGETGGYRNPANPNSLLG